MRAVSQFLQYFTPGAPLFCHHSANRFYPWGHSFLFSCPDESLRQLYTYPCNSLTDWLTHWQTSYFLTLKSNPRDLWPLRHLFRVMRRHDMTKRIDKDKYKDKDNDKDILRTPPKSNPRDLWPLRHLFRVMRRHDTTKKIDKDKYKDKDKDNDKDIDKDKDIFRAPPKTKTKAITKTKI